MKRLLNGALRVEYAYFPAPDSNQPELENGEEQCCTNPLWSRARQTGVTRYAVQMQLSGHTALEVHWMQQRDRHTMPPMNSEFASASVPSKTRERN